MHDHRQLMIAAEGISHIKGMDVSYSKSAMPKVRRYWSRSARAGRNRALALYTLRTVYFIFQLNLIHIQNFFNNTIQ